MSPLLHIPGGCKYTTAYGVQASEWRCRCASWMCTFWQSCFMEPRHGHLPLCLRRSLLPVTSCVWYSSHLQHVIDIEMLRRTNQTQLFTVLCDRRLRLFGYVARSYTDGQFESTAHISRLPSHWRRPPHWPRQSWIQTIERDLSVLSIGLHMPGSRTMATNCGSGYAPAWGLPSMMMMILWVTHLPSHLPCCSEHSAHHLQCRHGFLL